MNDYLADALDAVTDQYISMKENRDFWLKLANERSAEIIRLNARVTELEAEIAAMKPVIKATIDWYYCGAMYVDIIAAIKDYESKRLK
jgi:hypothetical protein